MAHARIIQAKALDLITAALAAGDAPPSDAALVESLRLGSPEQARSLLADLADAGKIAIDWKAEPRRIALGRKGPSGFTPARPDAPTVVKRGPAGKRADDDDADADRILQIMRGPAARAKDAGKVLAKAAVVASLAPAAAAPPPSRTARTVAPPAPMAVAPPPPPPPSEPAPAPLAIKRLPTAPGKKLSTTRHAGRQVNITLPLDSYAELERRAGDRAASQAMRDIVLEALEPAPAFETRRKPFIPAAVIRAAAAAGQPLDVFVTAMITRGFAAHQSTTEGVNHHG